MNNKLSNIILTHNNSLVNDSLNLHNFNVHRESYYNNKNLINDFNFENLFQPLFYKNFSLDIVTESVFDYPHPYVSEKIFKSISTKILFIYVGPAHSLKFLKNIGFKTFSSYINEDYDLIENPSLRMTAIEIEIEKYVNKSTNEIQNILKDASPILEHNFFVLKNLYNNELEKVIKQLESQHV